MAELPRSKQDQRFFELEQTIDQKLQQLEVKFDAKLEAKLDAQMAEFRSIAAGLSVQIAQRSGGSAEKAMPESSSTGAARNSAATNARRKEAVDFQSGDKGRGNAVHLGAYKLDFPKFSGEDPQEWLRKAQNFFDLFAIPEFQKLDYAELHLEGKAAAWFRSYKLDDPCLHWELFETDLCRRFGELGSGEVIENFRRLQHSTTVQAYQEAFEELKSLMAATTTGLWVASLMNSRPP